MEAFEYAIKKDIRNNPIVREVDEAREREQWTWIGVAVSLVLLLLFSAWQHAELRRHGYEVERMKSERIAEESDARHLLLERDALRAPKRIEAYAVGTLHMVQPALDEAIVIERVRPAQVPASSVVAQR